MTALLVASERLSDRHVFLLHAAVKYHSPLLAVLATCKNKSTSPAAALVWLYLSTESVLTGKLQIDLEPVIDAYDMQAMLAVFSSVILTLVGLRHIAAIQVRFFFL